MRKRGTGTRKKETWFIGSRDGSLEATNAKLALDLQHLYAAQARRASPLYSQVCAAVVEHAAHLRDADETFVPPARWERERERLNALISPLDAQVRAVVASYETLPEQRAPRVPDGTAGKELALLAHLAGVFPQVAQLTAPLAVPMTSGPEAHEPPLPPLAPGWTEAQANGRVYYAHAEETRWERPGPGSLVAGWSEHEHDGRRYYFHARTETTQWERPGVAEDPAELAARARAAAAEARDPFRKAG